MSISPISTTSMPAVGTVRERQDERLDRREARRDLRQALRSDDLAGAKEAFVSLSKNARDGASWNPDAGYAAIGRALKADDIDGAKAAYAELRESRKQEPVPPGTNPISLPAPAPVDAAGGGAVVGTQINTTA